MKNLSTYKACLFDVDKTLTNSSRRVTPRTRESISRLYEMGFIVGICTGRHFATLYDYVLPFFPEGAKHITAGGGQVIDTQGEVYWDQRLTAEATAQIIREAKMRNFNITVCDDRTIYSNSMKRAPESANVLVEPLELLPVSRVPIITVYGVDEAFVAQLDRTDDISYKLLRNYEGVQYTDITARGITKRSGLLEWCKLGGLTPEDVIGFGDGENDLEFLSLCGYSVAMGNASVAIKSQADEIIGTCDDEGVADFVDKNFVSKGA